MALARRWSGDLSSILLIAGGSIFCILGLIHSIYTAADMRNPRRLAPMDPAVQQQMASTGVRIARGRTSMWNAWLGFNFSHSLGAILFGSLVIAAGLVVDAPAFPIATLPALLMIAVVYFVLAIRFWFSIPIIGTGLATLCILAAWMLR